MTTRQGTKAKVVGLDGGAVDHRAIMAHAKSMDRVADAMGDIAAAIREHSEQRKPADEFYITARDQFVHVCAWLKRWVPRLAVTIPPVLVAINAISPNAAKAIAAALQALGAQ